MSESVRSQNCLNCAAELKGQYCGHCGQKMFSTNRKRKSGNHMTLACSSYNRNGTHVCYRNSIDEKPLLDFIVGSIQEKALAPEKLDRLRAELDRQVKHRQHDKPVNDNQDDVQRDVDRLMQQRRDQHKDGLRQIDRMQDQIRDGKLYHDKQLGK